LRFGIDCSGVVSNQQSPSGRNGLTNTFGKEVKDTMKIILKSAPAIAPRGKQVGTFIEARQEAGKDQYDAAYNRLVAAVQLDAKDKTGSPFKVEKSYNLLGRGVSGFSDDFRSWSRRALTQDEIEGFDPDVLIKGQKVVVEIAHRKVGKEMVAYIAGFHPAEAAVPA
jgi:hypothetical protein